jgi:hypothetical protein
MTVSISLPLLGRSSEAIHQQKGQRIRKHTRQTSGIFYRTVGLEPKTTIIDNAVKRLKGIRGQVQTQPQYAYLDMPTSTKPVHDESGPEIEKLMHQRPPRDLTGQVDIPFHPSISYGSSSSHYLSFWEGQKVCFLSAPTD